MLKQQTANQYVIDNKGNVVKNKKEVQEMVKIMKPVSNFKEKESNRKGKAPKPLPFAVTKLNVAALF